MNATESYARRGAGRIRTADETADSRRRVIAYWGRCELAGGTPVAVYAARRRVPWLAECPSIRYRPDCWHAATGRQLPAMIALIHDPADNIAALHRTYLTRDGDKARVTPNKATLGAFSGGAVRLHPACAEMVVGEGIETAAGAAMLTGLPAWSAVACGNLGWRMVLPAIVTSVMIAVDRDPAGESAARRAAIRWRAEGRTVRFLVPDRAGNDAADVLRAREVARG